MVVVVVLEDVVVVGVVALRTLLISNLISWLPLSWEISLLLTDPELEESTLRVSWRFSGPWASTNFGSRGRETPVAAGEFCFRIVVFFHNLDLSMKEESSCSWAFFSSKVAV